MNYLGHLIFSNNDVELMYANLYGDFVKGSNLDPYSLATQKGIRLHREIDHYIDNHPTVAELRHSLAEELPKIGGIAIDLFFDHTLAKYWKRYHPLSLKEFTSNFHTFEFNRKELNNSEFLFVIEKMKEGRWMYNYQFLSGLDFACSGLSRRIPFDNQLWKGLEVYKENAAYIDRTFHLFMKDAIPHFEKFQKTLL